MSSGNFMVDGAEEDNRLRSMCDCGANDWQDVSRCEYYETRTCDRHCMNYTDQCKPTAFKLCLECGALRETI
jgi:hypothetical protein